MEEDIIIEVYRENNTVVVKDSRGNSVEIETEFDSLSIQDCIDFLYCK